MSPREFARLAREQGRGLKGEGGGGGLGEKETPIFPSTSTFDFPFLLPSLQLSCNNSIGNLASQANYKEINITSMANGGDNHVTILPQIITLADCIFLLSRRSRTFLRQQPKRHVRISHHITIKPISIS